MRRRGSVVEDVVLPIFGALFLAGTLAGTCWRTYEGGYLQGVQDTQQAAAKAGVARYVANPLTGESTFEFITEESADAED